MPPQLTEKMSCEENDICERIPQTNNDSKEKLKSDSNICSERDWNCLDHIVWINVFQFILLHVGALYGAYLSVTSANWKTFVFAFFLYKMSMLGITAGVHRLWSHRAYKAKLPLRIFLAFCNSMAYQNSIYEWTRDHRVHHKYTETNADPHNSRRGFFFSHIGWVMCTKHPDVKKMGAKVDMSDVLNDPVVYVQKQIYIPSVILCCFVIPTVIPSYLWNESLWNSFFVAGLLRYTFALNVTFLVNSAAHIFGDHPYDKSYPAGENPSVAVLTLGEGYHNFHHTFPWDYSTSEWGWRLNLTTMFLDLVSIMGLAYEFRKVTPEMIKTRMNRTGIPRHDDDDDYNVEDEHEY